MPVWQKTPEDQVPYLERLCHCHALNTPSQSASQSLGGCPGTAVPVPENRAPEPASRSLQPILGKHGHLQAGAPAPPADRPAPGTLLPPAVLQGVGRCCPPRQLFQGLGSPVHQEPHPSLKKAYFCFQKQLAQGAWEGWFVAQGWGTPEEQGLLLLAGFGSGQSETW